ncbi:MAG: DUF4830 domain-containing protein [Clostridia bacterium]|nr:DUF4830 domain-containing protein [Clostridia bacterium]
MFVVSMKTTRPRMSFTAAVVGILLVTVFTLAGRQDALRTQASATGADDSSRVAYLQALGYEVETQPVAVQEVLIPADSDPVFTAYNALQTAAGQDLTPYCGRRVKCWTYTVTNYPGEEPVQAHMYVYKDQIIGGDISSAVQGGFSHGLTALAVGQTQMPPTTGETNGQVG